MSEIQILTITTAAWALVVLLVLRAAIRRLRRRQRGPGRDRWMPATIKAVNQLHPAAPGAALRQEQADEN